jgi:hypothetical protein
MSNWRKHRKSTFQIKHICQKIERGKKARYSMFDAWIPIKDAESEIERVKQENARLTLTLKRKIKG